MNGADKLEDLDSNKEGLDDDGRLSDGPAQVSCTPQSSIDSWDRSCSHRIR